MCNIKKWMLVFSILLVLEACASQSPKPQSLVKLLDAPAVLIPEKTSESFLQAAPSDSHSYLFGIGIASTPIQSKNQALVNIAGKINVLVASESKLKRSLVNNEFSSSFDSSTFSKVDQTQLSNFNVIKVEKIRNEYYTLIRLDKQAFIQNKKSHLLSLDSNIEASMFAYKGLGQLARLGLVDQYKREVNKALAIAHTLNGLGEIITTRSYLTYLATLNAEASKITVSLKADGNSLIISNELAEFISVNGFRVTSQSPFLVIKLNSTKQEYRDGDAYEVSINCHLLVLDQDQAALSEAVYVVGRSYAGYAQAFRQASVMIAERLRATPLLLNLFTNTSDGL